MFYCVQNQEIDLNYSHVRVFYAVANASSSAALHLIYSCLHVCIVRNERNNVLGINQITFLDEDYFVLFISVLF